MKTSRPLLLSRSLVVISLAVGFVLAAGSAILSTVSTQGVAVASIRASTTQDTLLEINHLLASLLDAETGQRGYILTGLDDYLALYTRAAARLDEQLAGLAHRFEDSPAQQATLERINRLVAEKKIELSRTIELRRANKTGAALHIVDAADGLNTMNALRDAVRDLEQNELAQLAYNSTAVSRRATFFQRLGAGMLVVACALGGAGAILLLRRMNELEAMITVCAWTKRVKFNGAWVSFEDYLRARFNLQFTHGISEEAAADLRSEIRKEGAGGAIPSSPPALKHRPSFVPALNEGPAHHPSIKHA